MSLLTVTGFSSNAYSLKLVPIASEMSFTARNVLDINGHLYQCVESIVPLLVRDSKQQLQHQNQKQRTEVTLRRDRLLMAVLIIYVLQIRFCVLMVHLRYCW